MELEICHGVKDEIDQCLNRDLYLCDISTSEVTTAPDSKPRWFKNIEPPQRTKGGRSARTIGIFDMGIFYRLLFLGIWIYVGGRGVKAKTMSLPTLAPTLF